MVRQLRGVSALMMAGLLIVLSVAAPARADAVSTARTADGFGVLAGSADAPVQLEIFCEPQCPVCASFFGEAGNQLVGALGSRRLAVTYRWLTFLDDRRDNDVSARIGTALLLAGDPATVPVAYQNFVGELYRQQDHNRPGPTDDDVAAMARASGVPGPLADRIAAGEAAVDTAAMNAANRDRLRQANPEHPGTPTVYDLNTKTVLDTDDPGWLDRLMQAG